MLSEYDRAHIEDIIAGHGTWFTAELLRLINKASFEHKARLRLGFPEEVLAVENWRGTPFGKLTHCTNCGATLGSTRMVGSKCIHCGD